MVGNSHVPATPPVTPSSLALFFRVLGIRNRLGGSEGPRWGRKVDFPVTGYTF